MPKKDINYQKAVIYKIEHLENPELLYVGSTTDFTKRKNRHKCTWNNIEHSKYNLKIYQIMRENGGWDSFKIMIIKEYPCNSKTELLIEEDKLMKELKASLNQIKAYRTEEEKKEYIKSYNIDHKDVIKKYREDHKDNLNEYNKQYYQDHKDDLKEKQKEINKRTYQNNKEKIKLKQLITYKCECGYEIKNGSKSNHLKSKKHLNLI